MYLPTFRIYQIKFRLGRRKRDKHLKEIELHGQILRPETQLPSESILFGEVAQKW
jgi:hypothetical protein